MPNREHYGRPHFLLALSPGEVIREISRWPNRTKVEYRAGGWPALLTRAAMYLERLPAAAIESVTTLTREDLTMGLMIIHQPLPEDKTGPRTVLTIWRSFGPSVTIPDERLPALRVRTSTEVDYRGGNAYAVTIPWTEIDWHWDETGDWPTWSRWVRVCAWSALTSESTAPEALDLMMPPGLRAEVEVAGGEAGHEEPVSTIVLDTTAEDIHNVATKILFNRPGGAPEHNILARIESVTQPGMPFVLSVRARLL